MNKLKEKQETGLKYGIIPFKFALESEITPFSALLIKR
jgi:hypothetical protein